MPFFSKDRPAVSNLWLLDYLDAEYGGYIPKSICFEGDGSGDGDGPGPGGPGTGDDAGGQTGNGGEVAGGIGPAAPGNKADDQDTTTNIDNARKGTEIPGLGVVGSVNEGFSDTGPPGSLKNRQFQAALKANIIKSTTLNVLRSLDAKGLLDPNISRLIPAPSTTTQLAQHLKSRFRSRTKAMVNGVVVEPGTLVPDGAEFGATPDAPASFDTIDGGTFDVEPGGTFTADDAIAPAQAPGFFTRAEQDLQGIFSGISGEIADTDSDEQGTSAPCCGIRSGFWDRGLSPRPVPPPAPDPTPVNPVNPVDPTAPFNNVPIMPIVLDLDGDGFDFNAGSVSSAFFDSDNDGFRENISWLSGNDGFLITDLDGDGTVSSTNELVIANQTDVDDTDLQALAAVHDSNDDGVISPEDEIWNSLLVWRDLNQDGISDEVEISTLADHNIASIGLARTVLPDGEQLQNGNRVFATAKFTSTDGTEGLVGDVELSASIYGYKEIELDDGATGVELETGDKFVLAQVDETLNLDTHLAGYLGAFGAGGNDILTSSGTGSAILSGGGGDDQLSGGVGNDWLAGNSGIDQLSGGEGHDVLFVDADDLTSGIVSGGGGNDVVIGSGSSGINVNLLAVEAETAYGTYFDDVLDASGLTERTVIDGKDGDDVITGGSADDILSAGRGVDTILGGSGNDTLIVDGQDSFNGGGGTDTVFLSTNENVDINVTDLDVEIFFAGGGNDHLETDLDKAVALFGGGGNDFIEGGWGGDYLAGEEGNDRLEGGFGNDVYRFDRGDGQDTISDQYSETYSGLFGWERYHKPGLDEYGWIPIYRTETNEYDAGDADELEIGGGVALSDMVVAREGNHLVIGFKDPEAPNTPFADLTDKVTIEDWALANRKIEILRFRNGTRVNLTALVGHYGVAPDGVPVDLGAAMAEQYVGPDGVAANGSVQAGTAGADFLGDGEGDVTLIGGAGNDVLYGSTGEDLLIGGAGSDTADYDNAARGVLVNLEAETVDEVDVLDADGNVDTDAAASFAAGDQLLEIENVAGSAHADSLTGDSGANRLEGRAGNDTLTGGGGADVLDGGEGADELSGGADADSLTGGDGDDLLDGGAGGDSFDGGDGSDTVSYTSSTSGVTVDLSTGAVTGADAVGDTFTSIENLTGSGAADTLTGDAEANVLSGGAGTDTLLGADGADTLAGGADDDLLQGGHGDDVYSYSIGGGQDRIEDNGTAWEDYTQEETYTYDTTVQVWVPPVGENSGYWTTETVTETGTHTVTYQHEVAADSGTETLLMTGDMLPSDLLVRLVGQDMELAVKDAGNPSATFDQLNDRVVLADWQDALRRVEILEFGNGTRIDLQAMVTAFGLTVDGPVVDIGQAMENLNTLGTADTILVGTGSDDVLVGTDGDDAISGGAGDDTLQGGAGDDHLAGQDGDDLLDGGAGADTLDGGAGNDTVTYENSEEGVDVNLEDGTGSGGDAEDDELISIENLEGSANDDTLTGDDEVNTLSGGGGDDTLQGSGGADTLDGGDGTDTASYTEDTTGVDVDLGENTASGGDAEGDVLTDIENVTGGSGNDIIDGNAGGNALDGQGGDDQIAGDEGSDTIYGGADSDFLAGGAGDDLYVYTAGDGIETIVDEALGTGGAIVDGGTDTLQFGTGIGPDNLQVERSGDDLLVGIKDPANPGAAFTALDDRITLDKWFDARYRIEAFQFDDGTRQSVREIVGYLATDGADDLTWTETDAYIDGGLGNDTLTTGGGADRLTGGDGNDTLSSGGGSDVITGDAGDDTLSGGLGNDDLTGGIGNDLLINSGGTDIYRFSTGDGTDTIRQTGGSGRVLFGEGIAAADVVYTQEGDHLRATISGSDSILVEDWFTDTPPTLTFELSDGAVVPVIVSFTGTANAETLDGTARDDAITGLGGDDTINARLGNDTLDGGDGADTLNGGAGDDTYSFARSFGNDTVTDYAEESYTYQVEEPYTAYQTVYTQVWNGELAQWETHSHQEAYTAYQWVTYEGIQQVDSGSDALYLLDGIALADLIVKQDGDDLLIGVRDSGSTITDFAQVSDQMRVTGWSEPMGRIERLQLANGTSVDLPALLDAHGLATDGTVLDLGLAMGNAATSIAPASANADAEEIVAGAGDDTVVGGLGADILDGGDGNDVLHGDGATAAANVVAVDRGSVKHVRGQDGTLVAFAADTTAIQFSSGGVSLGALLEGSATNIFTHSSNVGQWSAGPDTEQIFSLDTVAAPDSTQTADKVTFGATATHPRFLGFAVTQDTSSWTNSVFLKADATETGDQHARLQLALFDPANAVVKDTYAHVNLTAGTVETAGPAVGTTIEAFADGWYRVSVTTQNDGTASTLRLSVSRTISSGVPTSGSLYVWGAQTENGSTASSYIPTSGSAVTRAADVVISAPGDDTLVGGLGDDTLFGGDGADYLSGGEDNDSLDGGDGVDELRGGNGNDSLDGGDGDDTKLIGEAGNDTIFGGAGNDQLFGGTYSYSDNSTLGDDVLHGGAGNDQLFGAGGIDILNGDEGNDVLVGGDGADTLDGGTGVDELRGRDGNDVLKGGAGDDVKLVGEAGDDTIHGGDGNDTLWGGNYDGSDNHSLGDDTLYGDAGDDKLFGAGGTDQLFGGTGNDDLVGNQGDDVLAGGAGNDRLYGGDWSSTDQSVGNDTLNGEAGDDQLYGGGGDDILNGGEGVDELRGGEGNDTLDGGDGNDTLYGELGNDTLAGGNGDDTLNAGLEDDVLHGGAGADELNSGSGNDQAWGGDGDDLIRGHDGNDTLYGELGNDTFIGGGGNDTIFGGDGDDHFEGGSGADDLTGGNGSDTISYAASSGAVSVNLATGGGHTNQVLQSQALGVGPWAGNGTVVTSNVAGAPDGSATATKIAASTADAWHDHRQTVTGFAANQVQTLSFFAKADGYNLVHGYLTAGDGSIGLWVDLSTKVVTTEQNAAGALLDTSVEDTGNGWFRITVSGTPGTTGDTGVWLMSAPSQTMSFAGDGTSGVQIWGVQLETGTVANQYIETGASAVTLTSDATDDSYASIENVEGSAHDDVLTGDDGDNQIDGGAGNDTLRGDEGDDTLIGGAGVDRLLGGDGNDLIQAHGDGVADYIDAGDGDDVVELSSGTEDMGNVTGGAGQDTVRVMDDDGLTLVMSDVSFEVFEGGGGAENISTVGGTAVSLSGNGGDDTLSGGDGADTLIGGAGDDTLNGGAGTDVFEFASGDGNDVIDNTGEGPSTDLLRFTGGISMQDILFVVDGDDIVLTLEDGTGSVRLVGAYSDGPSNGLNVEVADRTMSRWELVNNANLEGVDNVITGDGGSDFHFGASGNDTIYGHGGNDHLVGASGADVLYGGDGSDTVQGGSGNDVQLVGEAGDDTIHGGEGNDQLFGGTYSYTDNSTLGDDVLHGGAGNDQLFGAGGADILNGDEGNDVLVGGDGADTLDGGAGVDELRGRDGNDVLRGGDGDDTKLVGEAGDDTIHGGDGNDQLFGGDYNYGDVSSAGDDVLHGEAGNDQLYGAGGSDTLYGGDGNDSLGGGNDDDTLDGGAGDDYLNGQAGNDTFLFGTGYGTDTLQPWGMDGATTDTLEFVGGLTRNALWLSQSGDHLNIDLLGSSDRIILQNWYASGTTADGRVDRIEANGEVLTEANVQQLVNAMATWSSNNGGQGGDDLTSLPSDTDLTNALAAAWQPIT